MLKHRWQNWMLLVASCIFYASWDWRFLFLLFASISVDFFCATKIHASGDDKVRKKFLVLSLAANLSILAFFKYFNFFTLSLQSLLTHVGINLPIHALNIILPLGISFYTFEAMSYVWDVYRHKMKPIRHYSDYALFVTYFPHLIAGPIMRAKDLLPQICFPRKLTRGMVAEGVYLVLWGMFEKIFIADNLANIVNPVFAGDAPYHGAAVLLALYAFAFQIFCDFDGYSNIARGLGRLMGFDIMFNFNLPYFATNPREFWQRWHISLSTWLRDYLYIPLGGNKNGQGSMYRNMLITMLLGGLWHGASWTFVIWGAYQGVLLVIHRFVSSCFAGVFPVSGSIMRRVWHAVRILLFFHVVCLGWLFFRAKSFTQIGQMMEALLHIFHPFQGMSLLVGGIQLFMILLLLLMMQVFQFLKKDLLFVLKEHWLWQGIVYSVIIISIMVFGANSGKEFIYFQF
ncbi:MAG: MBOAT family O-acyltransferase [Candidatus Omnitrophota bacterium]